MRTIFLILLFSLSALLMAQIGTPFGILRHSSVDASDSLHMQWDDLTGGEGSTECYYNVANGAWQTAMVTNPSEGTFQALLPYTYGQRLRYRLRYTMDYMGESFCFLHPAYWDADSFPPVLTNMAFIGTDPEGDAEIADVPALDLRDSYCATTAQKLYFTLQNVSGTYPTYVSITNYNIYMSLISNPEAANQDIAFAMIYSFNIPGIISSGLYKVAIDPDTSVPSFSRIGNIQSQVSGGMLHLACDITDLANDPDFGAWPNESSSLIVTGTTLSAAIDLITMQPTLNFADYSSPAFLVFQDNLYDVMENTMPAVEVSSYDTIGRIITFSYSDTQADYPLIAEVQTAGGTVVQAIPTGYDFSQNVIFTAELPEENLDVLSWRFSDNGFDFVSGTYSPSPVSDLQNVSLPISCNLPNPFSSSAASASITLKGLDKAPLKVQLFNLRGQKLGDLFSGMPGSTDLNIAWDGRLKGQSLPSGVYFLLISQNDRKLSHKFVISK